jgi:hypothetical protein
MPPERRSAPAVGGRLQRIRPRGLKLVYARDQPRIAAMAFPNRTKYLVVGAGIHGLSSAYHLATGATSWS